MKKHFILIVLFSGLLFSCGVQEETVVTANAETNTDLPVDENPNTDENNNTDMQPGGLMLIDGTVRDMNDRDGCGFLIETASATGDTTYLEPLKLPENYQRDGMTIKLAFRYSRRPSNCAMALPIIIDKIEE